MRRAVLRLGRSAVGGESSSGAVTAAAARAACGQRVRDALERGVVVGGADEPRLVRRRRQVDPAREHLVEEGLVAQDVLLGGGRVVDDLVVGEEDAEQAARRG
jgi:hypothetical protein